MTLLAGVDGWRAVSTRQSTFDYRFPGLRVSMAGQIHHPGELFGATLAREA